MEDDERLPDCGQDELYGTRLTQTIPAVEPQLNRLRNRVEELQRTNPALFARRMQELGDFINKLK